jgi:hypothetical protein
MHTTLTRRGVKANIARPGRVSGRSNLGGFLVLVISDMMEVGEEQLGCFTMV